MATEESYFERKYGLQFTTCITCGFHYDTLVGHFDNLDEVMQLAKDLHKDNKPKCKKRQLIIEYTEFLLYERYKGEKYGIVARKSSS